MNRTFLWTTILVTLTQHGFSNEAQIQTREMPQVEMQKQNYEIVELAANELNKTLPQTIDKYTKLVKIEGKDTTLLYVYEINTGVKSDEAVQKEDKTRMKEAVTYGICRSSKRFLDAQISISYLYVSATSKVKLFRFDVSQTDCLK